MGIKTAGYMNGSGHITGIKCVVDFLSRLQSVSDTDIDTSIWLDFINKKSEIELTQHVQELMANKQAAWCPMIQLELQRAGKERASALALLGEVLPRRSKAPNDRIAAVREYRDTVVPKELRDRVAIISQVVLVGIRQLLV